MGLKRFCDKCGADVTDQKEDNEFTFTGKRNTRFGIDARYYLCNKCKKEFDKFMGNNWEENNNSDI